MYKIPLDTPLVKENCPTGFERTKLSSSDAIRPTFKKAEARLSAGFCFRGNRTYYTS